MTRNQPNYVELSKGNLTMKAPSKTLEPFRINISDEVLNDLTARLKATRFAPDLNNEDMSYHYSCYI
jgi:hypothetical protein